MFMSLWSRENTEMHGVGVVGGMGWGTESRQEGRRTLTKLRYCVIHL